MGSVWMALANSPMLNIVDIMKPTIHKYNSIPSVFLVLPRQNVMETSNNPAINSIIQFIDEIVGLIFLSKCGCDDSCACC